MKPSARPRQQLRRPNRPCKAPSPYRPRGTPPRLDHAVADIIRKLGVLAKGDFVVAVSGGPDSVALAIALKMCQEQGIVSGTMHVAHLNHRLRGKEADKDAGFVRRLARRLGATYHLSEQDVRALAKARKIGIEEAAREARYAFFCRVAHEVGARWIAIGHTADDNVETVLQRILRGTGPAGLSGIPLRRPAVPRTPVEIVRPLLSATRSQVLAFLRTHKTGYRRDTTNRRLDYTRNRIRGELLPLLQARYNPQVQQAILRLSRAAAAEHEFVMEHAKRWLRRARPRRRGRPRREDAGFAADRAAFRRMPPALQPLCVRELLAEAGVGLKAMTLETYERAARFIGDGLPGRQIHLPSGICLRLTPSRVLIPQVPGSRQTHCRVPGTLCHMPIPVPGQAALPGNRALHTRILPGGTNELRSFLKTKSASAEMLDADRVSLPIAARGLRAGDAFRPLGSPGSKKVADLLSSEKVPRQERPRIPIVCDREGIIWVAGLRIADRVKVTPKTRRLLELALLDAAPDRNAS